MKAACFDHFIKSEIKYSVILEIHNIKSKFRVVIKLCYFSRIFPHASYLYTPSLYLPTSLL